MAIVNCNICDGCGHTLERDGDSRELHEERCGSCDGSGQMDDGEDATDPVNHPSHYTGAIECIDAIESALGREQFIGFLRGQVIKYQWRLGKKDNAAQDAAKAKWYAERLEKFLA
jgi:hypothetical protein